MANGELITYDLRAPGRNYNALYDEIKECGNWAKITESSWLLKTDKSFEVIRDKLLDLIDTNDRLFVAALTGEAYWYNTICTNEQVKEGL